MSLLRDPERRRWLIFAAFASVYGLVSIYRLSTAVLADELTRAFEVTGTELGTLHAAFFVVYAALQLPAGVVADRLGSRWAVVCGTVLMSAGGAGFALADSYPVAFAARAVIGLGGGFLFIAILRFAANWYRPAEFARMSGLTMSVAGVGGILATTPLAVAVARLGWRTTFLGLAGFGVAIAAVAAVVARDTPEDAGLEPVEGVPTPGVPTLRGVARNARRVLAERETWLAGIVLFAGTGVNITVFGLWGVPYLVQSYGLSVTGASVYTLLGSVGLLVGPLVLGWLSDRLERRTPIVVAGNVVFTVAFASLAVTGHPPLVLVAIVFFLGGFLAGTFALVFAVAKERHGATASGVATGTVNTMAFVGAAVMPTLMGFALDTYWTGETIGGARVYSVFGYRVAFALAAAAGVVAVVASLWLHARTETGIGRQTDATASD